MAACVIAHAAIALPDDGQAGAEPARAMGFRPPTHAALARNHDADTGKKTRAALKTSMLPTYWNSCDQGWISPVRNQLNIGACWAFATYATLEAQLRKAAGDQGAYDLSEKNMVNLHGYSYRPNDGGNYDVAAAYLLRWGGAVAETNDVFVGTIDEWTESPALAPIVHVQNVVWVPPLDGNSDSMTAMKQAIMDYGAVAVSTYWTSSSIQEASYCPYITRHNHAVTLVGWDDAYPAGKFKPEPPEPGAWIMRNSWGDDVGSNGYHYVSYYDANIAREYDGAVFVPATADENYDVVRGYDRLGPVAYFTASGTDAYSHQAAVFTAQCNERLEAVGVYSGFLNQYEISIYTNVTRGANSPIEDGALATSQCGSLKHAGFTTVHLEKPVGLEPSNSFAVVYRQIESPYSVVVECSYTDNDGPLCKTSHQEGNSYFGYIQGKSVVWKDGIDIEDYHYKDELNTSLSDGWAACIKAYTRIVGAVREGDMPHEQDNGKKYLEDLTNSVLYAETGETFGASAGMVGANGRTLWASWLTGLDPGDPGATDLKLSIAVTNSVPYLSWTPNLGADRTYTIYGTTALGPDGVWEAVGNLATTTNRFFKVAVGQ